MSLPVAASSTPPASTRTAILSPPSSARLRERERLERRIIDLNDRLHLTDASYKKTLDAKNIIIRDLEVQVNDLQLQNKRLKLKYELSEAHNTMLKAKYDRQLEELQDCNSIVLKSTVMTLEQRIHLLESEVKRKSSMIDSFHSSSHRTIVKQCVDQTHDVAASLVCRDPSVNTNSGSPH